jgi:hypothetical protein
VSPFAKRREITTHRRDAHPDEAGEIPDRRCGSLGGGLLEDAEQLAASRSHRPVPGDAPERERHGNPVLRPEGTTGRGPSIGHEHGDLSWLVRLPRGHDAPVLGHPLDGPSTQFRRQIGESLHEPSVRAFERLRGTSLVAAGGTDEVVPVVDEVGAVDAGVEVCGRVRCSSSNFFHRGDQANPKEKTLPPHLRP